jgi:hypothetical protein
MHLPFISHKCGNIPIKSVDAPYSYTISLIFSILSRLQQKKEMEAFRDLLYSSTATEQEIVDMASKLNTFGDVFSKDAFLLSVPALNFAFKQRIISPAEFFLNSSHYTPSLMIVMNGPWGDMVKMAHSKQVKKHVIKLIISIVKGGGHHDRHQMGDFSELGSLVKNLKVKIKPEIIAKRAKCDISCVNIVLEKMFKLRFF